MLKALSRRLTQWLNQVLLYLRLPLDLSERICINAPNTHFKKNACYLLVRDHLGEIHIRKRKLTTSRSWVYNLLWINRVCDSHTWFMTSRFKVHNDKPLVLLNLCYYRIPRYVTSLLNKLITITHLIINRFCNYGTKRAIHPYKKVLGPGQTPYNLHEPNPIQPIRLMWSSAFDPVEFDWFYLERLKLNQPSFWATTEKLILNGKKWFRECFPGSSTVDKFSDRSRWSGNLNLCPPVFLFSYNR